MDVMTVGYSWRVPRAIALCGCRRAQDEALAISVVACRTQFAAPQAVARRSIVTQPVQRHASDERQIGGRMVLAGAAGILATLHVQDPVWLMFNRPMAADRLREARDIGERAQNIATLGRGAIPNEAGGRDPPHCLEPGPLGLGHQPVDSVAQDNAADLDPSMILVEGVQAR